tara:strand:- start:3983 stop:4513 length:531 start_codon:yes stop_codon:yes gene_type:complete
MGNITGNNTVFEDGKWWYIGQADGRRRSLKAHNKKNHTRMYVNGKYIPKTHPLHKPGRYKSFGDLAFVSLENYSKIKEGHVYAIVNDAWPEWVKIGKALDSEDRLNGYQTSSPMRDYRLLYSVYSKDRNVAERKAHHMAEKRTKQPWNKVENGEWFNLTEQQAIEILKEIEVGTNS